MRRVATRLVTGVQSRGPLPLGMLPLGMLACRRTAPTVLPAHQGVGCEQHDAP